MVVAAPATAGAIRVAVHPVSGLNSPVNLVVDRWGVPHIYAQSSSDAFLAQGFNAARDRMFQIDLWLRKGLGRLAEVFGPQYVEQDRASRLFLYRGDMQREWASYGPEAKDAATRFAAGVNAYVDWLEHNPNALPEEFKQLKYKPKRWTPEDVVRIRLHALSYNLTSEVERARVACVVDVDLDRLRVRLEPEHKTVVLRGFDPCTLPEDVLGTYNLAKNGVQFTAGRLREVPVSPRANVQGSNNWAIGPSRTTTGRPILANDPHRGIGVPSSRYLAHLNAPGLDVIGAGEAFAPGISIGHNETSGFGLTVFQADQEDLYVYELDPADPGRYRYGGGWEDFTKVTEQVPVAGGGKQAVELSYTRHGPVIKVDAAHNRAYAVRAAWLEPGMSPYYGSMRYLRAKSFGEFREAVEHWGAPPLNHVYADTKGDIGWVVGALVPKRTNFDGLLPVPGDGRYEWNGFHSGKDLPRDHNPERGFVATANEFNLPPDYPKDRQLGYEWAEPSRHQRITEVLSAKPKSSLADTTVLQNDQLTVIARRMVKLLQRLPAEDPGTRIALDMLRGWDGVEHPDSAAAALFEVWLANHLGPGFVSQVLPEPAAELVYSPDITVLMEALENPDEWFGPDGAEVRDGLLLATLTGAFEEVDYRLGGKPADWKWGKLQQTTFDHPAAALVGEEVAKKWNVGPFPRGGSWNTVDVSVSYDFGNGFTHLGGASFRMALDVGNWDASQVVNTPGQSGDPNSPHYRDLAELWRTGKYFPLLYSRAAVMANAKQIILLLPK
ncbi:penicillin amidase [Saccharothrix tamanrassetensis]|uniref:Penicillin amidase n=1 Tax=Saccharothrix tamanrassetensis TaxID=1051531 RepID=A0A841CMN6_9PSEU|nr:penicillin acylase family protein [Saccharothrix tamanrassetensis]MBB5958559.1 penicillin amidase [Saccharothrix tamanrassetensis]